MVSHFVSFLGDPRACLPVGRSSGDFEKMPLKSPQGCDTRLTCSANII